MIRENKYLPDFYIKTQLQMFEKNLEFGEGTCSECRHRLKKELIIIKKLGELKIIGRVESRYQEPVGPDEMEPHDSIIVIEPEFAEGLNGIENNDYLQVIFYLHRSGDYVLNGPRRQGEVRGVFASRSPNRPNPLGLTTVELIAREGHRLKVRGLDAIDGTPVVDVKPYSSRFDKMEEE